MRCPIMLKLSNNKRADAMTRAFSKGIVSLKNVAKASKKLKLKPRTLKSLGSGAEGSAYLMNHPKHGLAVNKVFNTKGSLYHPDLIKDKVNIMKKMKGKGVAKYYGKGYGDDAMMMEYVKGKPADYLSKDSITSGLKTKVNVFMRTGKVTSDYVRNPSNMIKMPSGKNKVIDFLPNTKSLHKTPLYKAKSEIRKDLGKGFIKSVKTRGLRPKAILGDFVNNARSPKNVGRLEKIQIGSAPTIKPYKGFTLPKVGI